LIFSVGWRALERLLSTVVQWKGGKPLQLGKFKKGGGGVWYPTVGDDLSGGA